VLPRDHNYAGLGAHRGSTVYLRMPTPQLGVRAQRQHLRDFADPTSTAANLGAPFVARPGYDTAAFDQFSEKGRAPRWIDLDGRWAVPGTGYGETILEIYNSMRTYAGLAPVSASGALGAASALTNQDLWATTTFRH
jgi:hypothetical protein